MSLGPREERGLFHVGQPGEAAEDESGLVGLLQPLEVRVAAAREHLEVEGPAFTQERPQQRLDARRPPVGLAEEAVEVAKQAQQSVGAPLSLLRAEPRGASSKISFSCSRSHRAWAW